MNGDNSQTRNLTIIVKGGTNVNNITIDNKNSDKAIEVMEHIIKTKQLEQEMQKEAMNLVREITKDLKETILKFNTKKTKKSSKK